MGRICVDLGIKIGETRFIFILITRRLPEENLLVGATPPWNSREDPRVPGQNALVRAAGPGALPLRFFPSSFLDSFSILSSPFQSINLQKCKSTIIRTSSVLSPNHRIVMESQRTIENAPKLAVSRKIT